MYVCMYVTGVCHEVEMVEMSTGPKTECPLTALGRSGRVAEASSRHGSLANPLWYIVHLKLDVEGFLLEKNQDRFSKKDKL